MIRGNTLGVWFSFTSSSSTTPIESLGQREQIFICLFLLSVSSWYLYNYYKNLVLYSFITWVVNLKFWQEHTLTIRLFSSLKLWFYNWICNEYIQHLNSNLIASQFQASIWSLLNNMSVHASHQVACNKQTSYTMCNYRFLEKYSILFINNM